LGKLLLKYEAVMTVTFDGAEIGSMIQMPAPKRGGPAPGLITLAQFYRLIQSEKHSRVLLEKKTAVIHRMVALGESPPALSEVRSEQDLTIWISQQKPEISSALRKGSDSFRAFMRTEKTQRRQASEPQAAPAEGSEDEEPRASWTGGNINRY
jgi:dsDNA-binding SOS-regulon protein